MIKEKNNTSRLLVKITLVALFAAFTAAGAFIAVPIGLVPIVLQNIFAILSGLILGPIMGGAAVALYLLAGLLGLPVFAGGTGGLARFVGPTGGFLVGYLLAAIVAGLIVGKPKEDTKTSLLKIIIAVFSGILIVYVPGVTWLKFSSNLSWVNAIIAGFVPFVAGDIIKGIAAIFITDRLRKIVKNYL